MKRASKSGVDQKAVMMAGVLHATVANAASQDMARTKRNYVNALSRVACAVAENNPTGEALDAIKAMLGQMSDAQRG